jgi:hypothetical protein
LYAQAAAAERVTVSFDAEDVTWAYENRYITLSGAARLYSQVADDPSRFVRMQADLIEGDLASGRFELLGDVRIATAQGTLEGASAWYDSSTAQFALRRGGVMFPLTGEGEEQVCGYAYALDLASEGEIVYLTDAVFTTCNRADPHYALEVDRLYWDREAERVTVRGGALKLYGLRIPLVPKLTHELSAGEESGPDLLPIPGYTSRDGLRVGWSLLLSAPDAAERVRLGAQLRQRRGIGAFFSAETPWGADLTPRLYASLNEDTRTDADEVIAINRLPEIGIAGRWDFGGDRTLLADLSAGRYRQHDEETAPNVTEDRARLSLRLAGGTPGDLSPGSSWWWLDAAHSLYGDGGHYTTLGAAFGGATELAPWLAGSAELRHYLTDGASPFEWDDIDIETELRANSEFRMGPAWRVRLGGRYDLQHSDLRTWSAELRRVEHCLTWKAGYRNTSDLFTIGVEINGLLGNDEIPEGSCQEDGPPDYWAERGDDGGETPPTNDTAQPTDTASEATLIQ